MNTDKTIDLDTVRGNGLDRADYEAICTAHAVMPSTDKEIFQRSSGNPGNSGWYASDAAWILALRRLATIRVESTARLAVKHQQSAQRIAAMRALPVTERIVRNISAENCPHIGTDALATDGSLWTAVAYEDDLADDVNDGREIRVAYDVRRPIA
jgi:hypothetical protein